MGFVVGVSCAGALSIAIVVALICCIRRRNGSGVPRHRSKDATSQRDLVSAMSNRRNTADTAATDWLPPVDLEAAARSSRSLDYGDRGSLPQLRTSIYYDDGRPPPLPMQRTPSMRSHASSSNNAAVPPLPTLPSPAYSHPVDLNSDPFFPMGPPHSIRKSRSTGQDLRNGITMEPSQSFYAASLRDASFHNGWGDMPPLPTHSHIRQQPFSNANVVTTFYGRPDGADDNPFKQRKPRGWEYEMQPQPSARLSRSQSQSSRTGPSYRPTPLDPSMPFSNPPAGIRKSASVRRISTASTDSVNQPSGGGIFGSQLYKGHPSVELISAYRDSDLAERAFELQRRQQQIQLDLLAQNTPSDASNSNPTHPLSAPASASQPTLPSILQRQPSAVSLGSRSLNDNFLHAAGRAPSITSVATVASVANVGMGEPDAIIIELLWTRFILHRQNVANGAGGGSWACVRERVVPDQKAVLSIDAVTGRPALINTAEQRGVANEVQVCTEWTDTCLRQRQQPVAPEQHLKPHPLQHLVASGDRRDAWDTLLRLLPTALWDLYVTDASCSPPASLRELCVTITSMARSSTAIPVRIAYEPRGANELRLARHDVACVFAVLPGSAGLGFGCVRRRRGSSSAGVAAASAATAEATDGGCGWELGFVNLGHLDPKRLAAAVGPAPLPLPVPMIPAHLLGRKGEARTSVNEVNGGLSLAGEEEEDDVLKDMRMRESSEFDFKGSNALMGMLDRSAATVVRKESVVRSELSE